MLKAPSWFHCLFVDWEAQDPHVASQTDPNLEKTKLGPIYAVLCHYIGEFDLFIDVQ